MTPEVLKSGVAGGASGTDEGRAIGHGATRAIDGRVAGGGVVVVLVVFIGAIGGDRVALLNLASRARGRR